MFEFLFRNKNQIESFLNYFPNSFLRVKVTNLDIMKPTPCLNWISIVKFNYFGWSCCQFFACVTDKTNKKKKSQKKSRIENQNEKFKCFPNICRCLTWFWCCHNTIKINIAFGFFFLLCPVYAPAVNIKVIFIVN